MQLGSIRRGNRKIRTKNQNLIVLLISTAMAQENACWLSKGAPRTLTEQRNSTWSARCIELLYLLCLVIHKPDYIFILECGKDKELSEAQNRKYLNLPSEPQRGLVSIYWKLGFNVCLSSNYNSLQTVLGNPKDNISKC